MTQRPIYVGIGECGCGRVDQRLYHVPGTILKERAICGQCLEGRGYDVPLPRTAEDIEIVDGRPEWRETTVPYPKEPDVHVGAMSLGHGHTFEASIDAQGKLVGWLHTHPDARNPNDLCQSFCAVRPLNGAPVHQVVCADPLTLTPSLLCRTCGAHGHVTNGKWEPC